MVNTLKGLVKAGMFRSVRAAMLHTPLRHALSNYFSHEYRYNFTPAQLCFLCECVTRTASLPGPIVEVGCYAGDTTVFLNKHMESCGIRKRYYCIDTFSGFTREDIEHEVSARDKKDAPFDLGFRDNSKRWFDETMLLNRIDHVRSIQADVNAFDFAGIDDISFCLIDVDLYRPVRSALERVYDRVPKGGIIIVDDCISAHLFDGAFQAYAEFVAARNIDRHIISGKLGVIEKA